MYTSIQNLGQKTYIWNPWYGCYPISEACEKCFIKNKNIFYDKSYTLPYKDKPLGTVILVSLQSDFFLPEADAHRVYTWREIKENQHLIFFIITKRVERIKNFLPDDWGEGYPNVILSVTVENQKRADERIPYLLDIPAQHRWISCTPLLERVDISKYLQTGLIEGVEALGEKCYPYEEARPLRQEWVEDLFSQCFISDVRFSLLGLGSNFIYKDSTVIADCSTCYHSALADALQLNNIKTITFTLPEGNVVY